MHTSGFSRSAVAPRQRTLLAGMEELQVSASLQCIFVWAEVPAKVSANLAALFGAVSMSPEANCNSIRVWAEVVSLPEEETNDRLAQTTPQWPIMHAVLQGVTRDQMMARHKSNHIQVAYAPDRGGAESAMFAKAAAMHELGLKVHFCGDF